MSDERRVIDTRVRPKEPEPTYMPDLVIELALNIKDRYDVSYHRKNTELMTYEPVVFLDLSREEMMKEHVLHIIESKPKTVIIMVGEEKTPLHPGVVRSIVEGKLGVAELLLR